LLCQTLGKHLIAAYYTQAGGSTIYPPATNGKIPARSPSFRRVPSLALRPFMNTILGLSSGRCSRSISIPTVVPSSISTRWGLPPVAPGIEAAKDANRTYSIFIYRHSGVQTGQSHLLVFVQDRGDYGLSRQIPGIQPLLKSAYAIALGIRMSAVAGLGFSAIYMDFIANMRMQVKI